MEIPSIERGSQTARTPQQQCNTNTVTVKGGLICAAGLVAFYLAKYPYQTIEPTNLIPTRKNVPHIQECFPEIKKKIETAVNNTRWDSCGWADHVTYESVDRCMESVISLQKTYRRCDEGIWEEADKIYQNLLSYIKKEQKNSEGIYKTHVRVCGGSHAQGHPIVVNYKRLEHILDLCLNSTSHNNSTSLSFTDQISSLQGQLSSLQGQLSSLQDQVDTLKIIAIVGCTLALIGVGIALVRSSNSPRSLRDEHPAGQRIESGERIGRPTEVVIGVPINTLSEILPRST